MDEKNDSKHEQKREAKGNQRTIEVESFFIG
jgi:hypothetical protein